MCLPNFFRVKNVVEPSSDKTAAGKAPIDFYFAGFGFGKNFLLILATTT